MIVGDQIYKFELIAPLDKGGFGNVWRARDLSIDRIVALKVLDASFQPIVSILEEARIANRLRHANVVPVLYADIAEFNGKQYALLAQEYVKGGSLSGKLNSRNFMPANLVLKYTIDVLSGLEYLHCNGIYHNDIKPSNILVGDFGQAQLADYGISGVDATGKSLSITPKNAYKIHRAPETASKNPIINPQTEVYQVGVTAFRLLNGISLIKDDFLNMPEKYFNDLKAKGKLPRTSDYLQFIPRSLKAVVNKALAVDIDNRFKTALEMRRRLENLAFPVCWTCDNAGELIGEGQKYTYSLQETNTGKNKFHLESIKKSKSSGRETRISRFCAKNINVAELNKLKISFFQWTTSEGN